MAPPNKYQSIVADELGKAKPPGDDSGKLVLKRSSSMPLLTPVITTKELRRRYGQLYAVAMKGPNSAGGAGYASLQPIGAKMLTARMKTEESHLTKLKTAFDQAFHNLEILRQHLDDARYMRAGYLDPEDPIAMREAEHMVFHHDHDKRASTDLSLIVIRVEKWLNVVLGPRGIYFSLARHELVTRDEGYSGRLDHLKVLFEQSKELRGHVYQTLRSVYMDGPAETSGSS